MAEGRQALLLEFLSKFAQMLAERSWETVHLQGEIPEDQAPFPFVLQVNQPPSKEPEGAGRSPGTECPFDFQGIVRYGREPYDPSVMVRGTKSRNGARGLVA